MLDLRAELETVVPSVEPSPWGGHEHVRGYGVFNLPFSSGHNLALRVFPVNDFASYTTLWHMQPAGSWSIYYQAPRPDIACPRYYGVAARTVAPARIDLEWRGPAELKVRVDRPGLEWTVWMREPLALKPLNALSRRLPLWTWRYAPLLKMRESVARLLGMGGIKLAGRMPSGHFGVLMPQRMYLIDHAEARLNGEDLGEPVRVTPNPKIGDVPLPARGVFAVGQAHWEILDEDEYKKTRAAVGAARST